ncbi:MAG: pyrroloquinoline quinone biosynthesis protein PqqB [Geminicoccaceae bacterium]
MRIIVLGSAAGGGFPQWNSACPTGERAWRRDPAARWRTQCALALSADDEAFVLLNAAPDLRQQILATPALQPRRAPRHSPIVAAVLTSGEIDAIAGLLTLRESQRFTLYATGAVHAVLAANPIFRALDADLVRRARLELEREVDVAPGLRVRPFAVPGKVALHMEDEAVAIGAEGEDVIGLEARADDDRRLVFVPGCAAITDALAQRLDGASLVLFDGTLWRDDEMIRTGTGTKSGARMGHVSLSGPDGTLAALGRLAIGRRILIHLNNTNPVLLDDSPERAAAEAAGFEVAFDGMEITL